MLLTANDIYKSYNSLNVLSGINLEVDRGEIISIVGASGAGKSTLLHILGTLDQPDSGTLIIDDKETRSMRKNEMAKFRNGRIGFVFQFHNLLPEFTARENVMIPGYIGKRPNGELSAHVNRIMETLGIKDRGDHKPSMLSGGEQQRVAVARALINDPAIVFADEPSGNLDSKNADDLHNLFFQLREELNQTFVIVTHNEEFANMADRKLLIKDGVIQDHG